MDNPPATDKDAMLAELLKQYPRLDRGMVELCLDVHDLLKADHGEDYDPETIFPPQVNVPPEHTQGGPVHDESD